MAITLMVNGRADSLGIEPEAPLPWALGDTLRRTARARFHTPTTVDGSALYGIDFSPPDLLYAAVDIAPVLVSVDRAPGATMSDLRCVVQLAEAVVWWRTATGRPDRRVRHVYAAVDYGDVINLDTARAQIEGDHCWPVGGHGW